MANAPATTSLSRRIETALKEARLPQALELAKQHVKQEPGPASEALLRKCYLKSGEDKVARGSFRDAHPLLSEAEQLAFDDPAWWERLAELRADLGDYGRALQLLEKVPDSSARPRILGRVADRAVREGPAGAGLLPADLKPQFELVRKAFIEYDAGRDAAAREALNGIGLSSPFLEWKLLLRGLMAWSTHDTPRALENWTRLNQERLPARLAAPFRFLADKAYAANLPANRYSAVARQADQLSSGVGDGMRRLRKFLASEETIPEALETARAIVPELKRIAPDIVPKLANVVYWALVAGGEPEDMSRFNRIFGSPVDDPQFFRLQAMVGEGLRRFDMAHSMWAKYEDWIAKTPERWPGLQAARARALILARMGRLALDWQSSGSDDEDELEDFFSMFVRNQRKRPQARPGLHPTAEECFLKASELAPDWTVPSMELLRLYAGNAAKALPAVNEALRRFPDNLAVLETAADFYERLGELSKAHDCIKRALAANPLDKELRVKAAVLALNDARRLAAARDLPGAHRALKEATDLGGAALGWPAKGLAAAIEIRAGDLEAARPHQEQLLAAPHCRIAGPYLLFVELSRLRLKKKELDPYQDAYNAALAAPAHGPEFAMMLDMVALYANEPIAYRGLKTHQKKLLDRITSAINNLNENDLALIATKLHQLNLFKPLQTLGEHGMHHFPTNAYFPFFVAEALFSRSRSDYVNYRVGACYRRAKSLVDEAKDGRYRQVRELLDERLKKTPDIQRWLEDRWDW